MTTSEPECSLLTLRLFSVLLESPSRQVYGFDLVRLLESDPGPIYPLLARLERSGWLEGVWEEPEPGQPDRPRRRFYRLTGIGERGAHDALDSHPAWGTAATNAREPLASRLTRGLSDLLGKLARSVAPV